jgi:hypothetical protein
MQPSQGWRNVHAAMPEIFELSLSCKLLHVVICLLENLQGIICLNFPHDVCVLAAMPKAF